MTYSNFESKHNITVPTEFRNYIDSTATKLNEYDDKFFSFYSWEKIKSVTDRLADQKGVPDCSNIIHTMNVHGSCYVFADYMFSMFFYAIFLGDDIKRQGHVYIICGDVFGLVANSFADFVVLYNQESLALQFG